MTKPNFARDVKLPTKAQAERLEMLVEECSEVIQAACKILRHGYEDTHPDNIDDKGNVINVSKLNRDDLEREIGDVFGIAAFMDDCGDIRDRKVANSLATKIERASIYMHHQDLSKVEAHIGKMQRMNRG